MSHEYQYRYLGSIPQFGTCRAWFEHDPFMYMALCDILNPRERDRFGMDFGKPEPDQFQMFLTPPRVRNVCTSREDHADAVRHVLSALGKTTCAENHNTEHKQKDTEDMKVDMPYINRYYTYVKTDKETGIKTLHVKAIFEDGSEVEVKGVGELAFTDGGKGEMLPNAKEVGLMYAIVRRLCGIKNFRQKLDELMSLEGFSPRKVKKQIPIQDESAADHDKTSEGETSGK